MQHICRRKCNIFVGPVQRIYYVCKPCAAFVSAFADCAHNTFSSTAQSIFAGPALNLYATSAHHIPGLFGFAQNIFASFVQSIFAGPGRHIGILAGLCSTPCPAEIGVAYRWAVLFWPLVLCPAQLVLAGFVVSYLQDLGGRLTWAARILDVTWGVCIIFAFGRLDVNRGADQ